MIHTLHLQRFKGHRATSVRLRPMTLLVGPNGSGKTSVLEALDALGALGAGRFPWADEAAWYGANVHRGERDAISLRAEGIADDHAATLALVVGPIPTRPRDLLTTVSWSEGGAFQESRNAYPADLPGTPAARMVHRHLLLRLDAARIAAAAPLRSTTPTVEADGFGTAPTLAAIRLADLETFQRIEALVREVAPFVERVHVAPAPVDGAVGFRVGFDLRGAPDVPADAASAGTLVTLALATALHAPTRPRLVLLDEIDHSLHPKAQMALARQLRAVVRARGDLQVVATTHSPYMLDAFELDEIRVMAQRPDGSVAVKDLAQHPDAARLQGKLSPGQLWSLDDEAAWVLGA